VLPVLLIDLDLLHHGVQVIVASRFAGSSRRRHG